MLAGDIHYNSEREPYNMMHFWYANDEVKIYLSVSSPTRFVSGHDGDIPEFQHASIPPTLNRVIVKNRNVYIISLDIVRARLT